MKIANLPLIERVFTSKGRKLNKLAKKCLPQAKGLTYMKDVKTGADVVVFSRAKDKVFSACNAEIKLNPDGTALFKHTHLGDWQNFSLGQNCETRFVEHVGTNGKIDSKKYSYITYYTDENGKKIVLGKTIVENGKVKQKFSNSQNLEKYKDSDYYKNKLKQEYMAGNIWAHLNMDGNFRRERGIYSQDEFLTIKQLYSKHNITDRNDFNKAKLKWDF